MQLVLVDDHPIVRRAMRELLVGNDPSIEILGEAETGPEAVALVSERGGDVVLMDLLLGSSNGIETTQAILRVNPDCRILIYTAVSEPAVAIEALAAGARGFAVKSDDLEELLLGIRQVAIGKRYVSPSLRDRVDEAAPKSGRRGLASLSKREREIFDLIVSGRTSVELARDLSISLKTVETHRSRINRKLGVHSTGQIVRLAALNGLFSSPS
jgi:DNA-binding NarL/FixJ family response regulator